MKAKELTIEEKAKAYDEALERARERYNEEYTSTLERSTLAYVFPELKESEDERIRKAIRTIILSASREQMTIVGVAQSDMFAWLEKQGEQKPNANCLLRWSEIEEKMLKSLEGIVKDYWAKAEQENNEIKIKEASEVSFFLKTIHKSPLCWIKCSDELPNRDGIYLVVTDGRHNDVYDMARYDSIEGWHKASEIIYWMPIPQLNNKSIIEQNPAWSEEDEENRKNILYILDQLKGTAIYKEDKTAENCIDWLKSLKDRYTWKPSEEMLEALYRAIPENVMEISEDEMLLDKLYQGLKYGRVLSNK